MTASSDIVAAAPTRRRTRPGSRLVGFVLAAAVVAAGSHVVPALAPSDPRDPAPAAGVPTIAVPGELVTGSPTGARSLETIDRSIAAWTKNLAANPNDFIAATNLATLYHGRGRISGDLGDHERALAASRVAIDIAPTIGPASALEAAILYTLHDFSGALAAAEALYADDPAQLGALATMADAKLELGRLAEARADLEALRLVAAGPGVDVRFARLAYLTGDADEALRIAIAARDAARVAGTAGGSATGLAFYDYAVGEYGRLGGDATTARIGYEAVLAEHPTDLGALVGLARVDAFEGHLDAAIAGLERAVAIAPQPEPLALLGDLLVLRDGPGDAAAAADAYATVGAIGTLTDLTGAVYDRQLLQFELDHGGATHALLVRALAAAEVRPDPAGLDLVAWAHFRLGRLVQAATAIEDVLASGTADARILYHAGVIRLAVGDDLGGRNLLGRALALGPALDPADRAAAQHAMAGARD